MTKKEIVGILAFAEAINSSWGEDKIFVSPKDDAVVVFGDFELVLTFVSSVCNMFCLARSTFRYFMDGSTHYKIY